MPPPSISLIPPQQSLPRPHPFSPPLPNFYRFFDLNRASGLRAGVGVHLALATGQGNVDEAAGVAVKSRKEIESVHVANAYSSFSSAEAEEMHTGFSSWHGPWGSWASPEARPMTRKYAQYPHFAIKTHPEES
jgi:hypothetical protein